MNVNGDRRKVIDYSERVSKRLLLSPSDHALLSTCTWYRVCLPRTFSRLFRDKIVRMPPSVWKRLVDAIPDDLGARAKTRCLQIVAEYAAPIFTDDFHEFFAQFDDEEDVLALLSAMGRFYEPLENRTCRWMKTVAAFDNRLFSQVVYRIVSGCICPRTVARVKRALVHARRIYYDDDDDDEGEGGPRRRVFLDAPGGQPMHVLKKVRRAFEHVLFSRYSPEDFTSPESPAKALTAKSPSDMYGHSYFEWTPTDKKTGRHLTVGGRGPTTPDLVLTGSPHKPFSYDHYAGTLDLLNGSGDGETVFLDGRLKHRILLQTSENFVFDPTPATLLQPFRRRRPRSENGSSSRRSTIRNVLARIDDLSIEPTTTTTKPTYFTSPEKPCQKENLLGTSTDADCERNRISVVCHVKDFLLWVIAAAATTTTGIDSSISSPSRG